MNHLNSALFAVPIYIILFWMEYKSSGKTLSYVLPLVQQLKHQEMFENYERRPKRPRILVLAPTRELAVRKNNHRNIMLNTNIGTFEINSQKD